MRYDRRASGASQRAERPDRTSGPGVIRKRQGCAMDGNEHGDIRVTSAGPIGPGPYVAPVLGVGLTRRPCRDRPWLAIHGQPPPVRRRSSGAGAGDSIRLVASRHCCDAAQQRASPCALGGWPDWAARARSARQDVEQGLRRHGRRLSPTPSTTSDPGNWVGVSRPRPPVGTMALVPLAVTKGTRAFSVIHSRVMCCRARNSCRKGSIGECSNDHLRSGSAPLMH